jgi:hypothetical protein
MSRKHLAAGVLVGHVHSRFVCHTHSFPQAGSDCHPVEIQTAPLPSAAGAVVAT